MTQPLKLMKATGKVTVEPVKDGMRIARGQKSVVVPHAELSDFATSVAGIAIALALAKR